MDGDTHFKVLNYILRFPTWDLFYGSLYFGNIRTRLAIILSCIM